MRLDILGANGTYPARGGACSGYLLRDDGFALWLDAGSGTLAQLQEHIDVDGVGAMFLSHVHADHLVDLYTYFYALWFHPEKPRGLPLYAPRGSRDFIARLLAEDQKPGFDEVFHMRELAPGDVAEAGPFRLEVFDSYHSAPNLTLRATSDGTIFCYSGDTGPTEHLPKAAFGADLFLCEASWQRDTEVDIGPIHMRAHEAGAAARAAGAGRMIVTHLWPSLDRERTRAETAEAFGGEVAIAARGEGTDV
jgi:ribonuclease BN (tRNA processing enzyme)